MEMGSCRWDILPFAGMVLVEFANVGQSILVKAATSKGMSNFIFIFYSYILGTLVLLPCSFFFSRNRPPLTFSLLCKFFLLGLIGYSGRIFSYTGIKYSSPTLAAALNTLIPGFTFILAIIFRLEKLHLKSSSTLAKSIGTLITISGALVATLYKGPSVLMTPSPLNSSNHLLLPSSLRSNWILGGFFLSVDCLSYSLVYIIQASILKVYPAKITLMAFFCFFGIIPSAIVSVIVEREADAWKLQPNTELIAIIYSGIIWFGLSMVLMAWSIHKKGPLYVALFKPLGIIIAAIMDITFLGDSLHLGSVIGSVIIVLGFYGVMWGKAKEEKPSPIKSAVRNCIESSTKEAPLLQEERE